MSYLSPSRLHSMNVNPSGKVIIDTDQELHKIRRELKEIKERIK